MEIGEGRWSIWAGAVSSKPSKTLKKIKWGPTDGRTDGQSRRTKVQTGKMTNTTKCEKNSQRENEDEKEEKIQGKDQHFHNFSSFTISLLFSTLLRYKAKKGKKAAQNHQHIGSIC